MEQLRFVARSSAAEAVFLVDEALDALRFVADDRRMLLAACRQLLTRQPSVGAFWTLCTRLILASDPVAEAQLILNGRRRNASLQDPFESRYDPSLLVASCAGVGPRGRAQALVTSVAWHDLREGGIVDLSPELIVPVDAWLPSAYWAEAVSRSNPATSIDDASEADVADSTPSRSGWDRDGMIMVEIQRFRRVNIGGSLHAGHGFDAKWLPASPVAPELLVTSI